MSKIIPLWAKLLACQLTEQTDIVFNIQINNCAIVVFYQTGICESYYFVRPERDTILRMKNNYHVIPDMTPIGKPITIYEDFEFAENEQYHYIINRGDYNSGSFLDKRLALQRLAYKLFATRSVPDCYPQSVLNGSLDKIRASDTSVFLTDNGFNLFPISYLDTSWRPLIEHFYNVNADLNYHKLWNGLSYVSRDKRIPIRSSDARKRAAWMSGKRIFNPLSYTCILSALEVESVIDLHPDIGHKAIACALLGIRYIAPETPKVRYALDRGLAEFSGLRYEPLGDQTADLLISDDNFVSFSLPQDKGLLGRCKRMLAFCPRSSRSESTAKYTPTSTYKIFTNPITAKTLRDCNYLLVW